ITLVHYVFRSTSSDQWTLIEGTGTDQRIEDHTSSVSGTTRTETITVKNYAATTVAKSVWTWTNELVTKTEVWTDVTAGSPGLTTQYAYNGDGLLSQVTAPDGGVKSYT